MHSLQQVILFFNNLLFPESIDSLRLIQPDHFWVRQNLLPEFAFALIDRYSPE